MLYKKLEEKYFKRTGFTVWNKKQVGKSKAWKQYVLNIWWGSVITVPVGLVVTCCSSWVASFNVMLVCFGLTWAFVFFMSLSQAIILMVEAHRMRQYAYPASETELLGCLVP